MSKQSKTATKLAKDVFFITPIGPRAELETHTLVFRFHPFVVSKRLNFKGFCDLIRLLGYQNGSNRPHNRLENASTGTPRERFGTHVVTSLTLGLLCAFILEGMVGVPQNKF